MVQCWLQSTVWLAILFVNLLFFSDNRHEVNLNETKMIWKSVHVICLIPFYTVNFMVGFVLLHPHLPKKAQKSRNYPNPNIKNDYIYSKLGLIFSESFVCFCST